MSKTQEKKYGNTEHLLYLNPGFLIFSSMTPTPADSASNNITVNSPFKSVSSEVFDGESRSQITSQVTERFGQ